MKLSRPVWLYQLMLLLLAGFWALGLYQLTVYPPVTADEPWIASTGWQLATRGVFGSPLFAGLWQMDQRYYDFMPLYPMLSAVVYRGAGVGVFQARFVSVGLACLVLALTFAVGRRLFNGQIGLIGVVVAVGIPLTIRGDTTGSLLLDVARLARYDVFVPVLELAACLIFLDARKKGAIALFLLAGMMAGLAGLAHLYGAFVILVLFGAALWGRLSWRSLTALGGGFLAPWGLYAIYVASGWGAFLAQTRWYGDRFDLFDPSWYNSNLVNEVQRYRFQEPLSANLFWGLGVAAVALVTYAALRQRSFGVRFLLVSLMTHVVGLAILVESKLPNYLAGTLPLFALTFAFGIDWCLHRLTSREQMAAVPLASALIAVLLFARQALELNQAQARTSPYAYVVAQLRAKVPANARVLSLHAYWFGMQDYEIRDWIVPLQWSTAREGETPLSMTAALERLGPQVVIIDPRIRPFLETTASDPRPAQVLAWLRAQNFHCAAEFSDRTYGTFQVYRRDPVNAVGVGSTQCSTP